MELSILQSPRVETIMPEQYVDVFVKLSKDERIIKNNLNKYINKIGDISFRILLVMFASYTIYASTLAGHPIQPDIIKEIMGDIDDEDFSQENFKKMNNLLDRNAIAVIHGITKYNHF
jgi:hypothetical protein